MIKLNNKTEFMTVISKRTKHLHNLLTHMLHASMLEPSGLDRGDGKRPDGITVYPYSRDRCLIWDATCVNTFASSKQIRAALAAGSVADAAEARKIAKYAELGRRFIFQSVAAETSGAMGKSTNQFCPV